MLKTIKRVVAAFFIAAVTFTPLFPCGDGGERALTPTAALPVYSYNGADLAPSARAASVYDMTGEVFLYIKNGSERLGMASTTKIMTGLLAAELLPPKAEIEISGEAVGVMGSSIYLAEGDVLTSESLLYGLLLESGNDAAVAIAVAVSGSTEKFVGLMNEKAKEIGLTDTNYVNPHGLSEPEHYTTARDLALLSAEAMKNERFRKIVSTRSASFKDVGSSNIRYYVNHNKLLSSYDGMIGIKTGYTQSTGRCLVTASEREGRTVIAVTLDDSADIAEHKAMHDHSFSEYEAVEAARPGEYRFEVAVTGGTAQTVTVTNAVGGVAVLPRSSELSEPLTVMEPFVYAPVREGDTVGALVWECGGERVCRVPLVADGNVPQKRMSLYEKIKSLLS